MLLPALPLCCEKDSRLLGVSKLITTDTSGKSSPISREELATTNLMEETPFLNTEKTKDFLASAVDQGYIAIRRVSNETTEPENCLMPRDILKYPFHISNSANISAVDQDFYGRCTLVFKF